MKLLRQAVGGRGHRRTGRWRSRRPPAAARTSTAATRPPGAARWQTPTAAIDSAAQGRPADEPPDGDESHAAQQEGRQAAVGGPLAGCLGSGGRWGTRRGHVGAVSEGTGRRYTGARRRRRPRPQRRPRKISHAHRPNPTTAIASATEYHRCGPKVRWMWVVPAGTTHALWPSSSNGRPRSCPSAVAIHPGSNDCPVVTTPLCGACTARSSAVGTAVDDGGSSMGRLQAAATEGEGRRVEAGPRPPGPRRTGGELALPCPAFEVHRRATDQRTLPGIERRRCTGVLAVRSPIETAGPRSGRARPHRRRRCRASWRGGHEAVRAGHGNARRRCGWDGRRRRRRAA